MKLLPKESVEEILVGDELFLLDSEDGRPDVHVLNSGATLIWMLCDGTRNVKGIARELAVEFGLPKQEVLIQVEETVAQFHTLDLLSSEVPALSRI